MVDGGWWMVGWWVGLTKQTNCCPMIGPRRPPRSVASFCSASYPVGSESQAARPPRSVASFCSASYPVGSESQAARPPPSVASFCTASYPVGSESQAALPCGPSCPCAPEADLQDQIGDVDDKIWTSLDPTPQSCRRPPSSFSLSLLNPFLPVSLHIRLPGAHHLPPATTSDHQRPPATTSDHQRPPATTTSHLQPPLSP
jgi:hypothetical protein